MPNQIPIGNIENIEGGIMIPNYENLTYKQKLELISKFLDENKNIIPDQFSQFSLIELSRLFITVNWDTEVFGRMMEGYIDDDVAKKNLETKKQNSISYTENGNGYIYPERLNINSDELLVILKEDIQEQERRSRPKIEPFLLYCDRQLDVLEDGNPLNFSIIKDKITEMAEIAIDHAKSNLSLLEAIKIVEDEIDKLPDNYIEIKQAWRRLLERLDNAVNFVRLEKFIKLDPIYKLQILKNIIAERFDLLDEETKIYGKNAILIEFVSILNKIQTNYYQIEGDNVIIDFKELSNYFKVTTEKERIRLEQEL